MNNEILKNKFDDLFVNGSEIIKHYANRGYWITKETKKNAIMYIGLNPSYPHKDYEMSKRLFYSENQQTQPYFKQIKEFHKSIKCNVSWTHFDLLIIRETRQSVIKKMCKKPDFSDFIKRNLELSKTIIEKSSPKIIVVANAFSRDLLKGLDWCGYSFDWDDEIGTYRFAENTKLDGTPVFFSSMLSGQRALDKGSRERMSWQINKALEISKK